MKQFILITVLPIFLLTGCNTIRGIGTDIASVGNSIKNTADKVSQNNQLRKQQTTQNYNNTYNQNTQNQTYETQYQPATQTDYNP